MVSKANLFHEFSPGCKGNAMVWTGFFPYLWVEQFSFSNRDSVLSLHRQYPGDKRPGGLIRHHDNCDTIVLQNCFIGLEWGGEVSSWLCLYVTQLRLYLQKVQFQYIQSLEISPLNVERSQRSFEEEGTEPSWTGLYSPQVKPQDVLWILIDVFTDLGQLLT